MNVNRLKNDDNHCRVDIHVLSIRLLILQDKGYYEKQNIEDYYESSDPAVLRVYYL